MNVEIKVAQHYTHGSLEAAILGALKAAGKNTDDLKPDDLSGADEFHLGWRQVTIEFAAAGFWIWRHSSGRARLPCRSTMQASMPRPLFTWA